MLEKKSEGLSDKQLVDRMCLHWYQALSLFLFNVAIGLWLTSCDCQSYNGTV